MFTSTYTFISSLSGAWLVPVPGAPAASFLLSKSLFMFVSSLRSSHFSEQLAMTQLNPISGCGELYSNLNTFDSWFLKKKNRPYSSLITDCLRISSIRVSSPGCNRSSVASCKIRPSSSKTRRRRSSICTISCELQAMKAAFAVFE